MARREVIEIICDRCSRTETQEPLTEAAITKAEFELKVTFHDQSVQYQDLCKRCRKACEGYFKSMTKQVEQEEKLVEDGTPERKGMFGLGGKKAG